MYRGVKLPISSSSHRWLRIFLSSLFFIISFTRPACPDPLTSQEKRGKQIYFEGTSPRGEEIEAFIGKEQVPVPGTVASCGSCHGPDGLGRPEAGVIPSNIRWENLTKPYGNVSAQGREYPPYTEESLKLCITGGIDPAENTLDPSMPIYSLSDEDLDDLIAYLKKLKTDLDPGLSKTSITIGTILPLQSNLLELGETMHEVMSSAIEDINLNGGIHNRQIKLISVKYDSDKESALQSTQRLVQEDQVFAMVGAVIAGADQEIVKLVENEKVPLIGPFTIFSSDPFLLNNYTFYLFSGLKEQARALVDFAANDLKFHKPRLAVLSPENEYYKIIREAIKEQCDKHEWPSPMFITTRAHMQDVQGIARRLKAQKAEAVFFYSPDGLKKFAEEAANIGFEPFIFMPGTQAQRDILDITEKFNNKIYLSYPTLPGDRTGVGFSEFETLVKKHGLSKKHLTSQVSAYTSVKILIQGLKRAGRDLSRDKLLRALEKLYQFQTGLTPPLTYGPNRRIGALGAYVVTLDLEKKKFVPTGKWITPR